MMVASPLIEIRAADGAEDIERVRELFRAYERFLGDTLGMSLCFQNFEAELSGLPGDYASPAGALYLAWQDGQAVGCIALRPESDGAAEMKRLFVRPETRGGGFGRRLVQTVVDAAIARGYRSIRLDTVPQLERAIALYRDLGFVDRPPYGKGGRDDLVYMEKIL